MPHTCPSEGKGEQPCARAAGVMGTSSLAWAPAVLAKESSPCLHMAGGPDKIGQELPPFTSLRSYVLPQHQDLLTHFQLTPGLNPLACVAHGVGLVHRVNKCHISGQPFAEVHVDKPAELGQREGV